MCTILLSGCAGSHLESSCLPFGDPEECATKQRIAQHADELMKSCQGAGRWVAGALNQKAFSPGGPPGQIVFVGASTPSFEQPAFTDLTCNTRLSLKSGETVDGSFSIHKDARGVDVIWIAGGASSQADVDRDRSEITKNELVGKYGQRHYDRFEEVQHAYATCYRQAILGVQGPHFNPPNSWSNTPLWDLRLQMLNADGAAQYNAIQGKCGPFPPDISSHTYD